MKLARLTIKLGTLLALAVILSVFFPQQSLTQNNQELYFEETGHWVKGDFLNYFNKRGGLEIFGYPISEEFVDQGLTVQYFQKARMERHPNNPEPYKVLLGLLGDELKYRQPPAPAPTPRSRRKVYFPETGHTVSYAFLDYFRAHGAIDIFGYPITEMHFEDGKIVQYFQRLKMEWHPDDPTSTVRVGNLGELYVSIYRDRMPPSALNPVDPNARVDPSTPIATPEVTSIRAVVSLRYSVMSKKRNQVVSVLVTDNNGQPRPDAQVTISFETPTGETLPGSTHTHTTDERGFVQASVPVNEGRSGTQIIVKAAVTYGQLSTTAQNVFLLWW